MPHIPKSLTTPSEGSTRKPARSSRPPAPYHGSSEHEQPYRIDSGLMERISPRKWEGPDGHEIMQRLYGKQPTIFSRGIPTS